jgi:ribosomal protein S18 acetylase RimI-like enzyme
MNDDLSNITIRRGSVMDIPKIMVLNKEIFGEDRLINSLDHDHLIILLAETASICVGFKIGYNLNSGIFYSAKGGVLSRFRRKGIGKAMIRKMEEIAQNEGYSELRYHTFPTRWPGMLSLGRSEGYDILEATWNPVYNDYQILLSKKLVRPSDSS